MGITIDQCSKCKREYEQKILVFEKQVSVYEDIDPINDKLKKLRLRIKDLEKQNSSLEQLCLQYLDSCEKYKKLYQEQLRSQW